MAETSNSPWFVCCWLGRKIGFCGKFLFGRWANSNLKKKKRGNKLQSVGLAWLG